MLACAGCATETPAEDNAEKRASDIETLNTIIKLEQALSEYACTLPGIGSAEVKVRPNAAVAILTPKKDAAIPDDSVSALRDKITANTGIHPENITVIRKHK